jgi:lactate permease
MATYSNRLYSSSPMPWSHDYTPLGGLALSAAVAAIPVVVLLGLLALFHVKAHFAALAALVTAAGIAIFVYQMPWQMTAASAGFGAAFGLFPIGWIVLNAIFIYEVSVTTGQFEALKSHIAGVASDRRIQALLIAFSFGAFIEGAAGFGAPVAISSALLIGLGFKPLKAAKLSLIGNTAPVAFGSLGIPIITLSTVTGLDLHDLSAMVGRQLPLFSLIVPFWLVAAQAGLRGMREVWPACLVTGASFGFVQFLVSNFHGPWLVDLASSLASMGALVVLLRFWQPRSEVRSEDWRVESKSGEASGFPWRAWLPWICLSVLVFLWSVPLVKENLNKLSPPKVAVPGLHLQINKMPPAAPEPEAEKALFDFNWLSATGTALLLAGVISGLMLGVSPVRMVKIYGRTIWRVRISLLTIALMLALGFTTRYAGSDTTMGLAMASTGKLFPFFSPLLGWLGVALTGSDTSSNVLFGNLQKVTAEQLGLSPILTAASNSSGGVMGKMIDAQSIVVASAASGAAAAQGGEKEDVKPATAGEILRSVFWHSLALAILVGLLVMAQAYLFPQIVPH